MKESKNQEIFKKSILRIVGENYNFVYDLCRNIKRSDKKLYKSISSNVDKRMKLMQNVRPSYTNSRNNLIQGLFYVLDIPTSNGCFITGMNEGDNNDLIKWIRDKEFKIFYKKVLIAFTIIEEKRDSITLSDEELDTYTYFLLTKAGVLFTYFIHKEKNITVEKIKSFLSKVFDWKSMILNFAIPLTTEQEMILDEIKTGIKYLKLKGEPSRNNVTYENTHQYNVLDDMKNNITIEYFSGKNGKHIMHKLPVKHWRTGHWRNLKNGNTVWIEGKYVGGNQEKSYAA